MNAFDRREAEIEVDHCIASLRQIIKVCDDPSLISKIMSQIEYVRRDGSEKDEALYRARKNTLAFPVKVA